MKPILKSIRMTDFKGVKETREVLLGGNGAIISGCNGSGKSTVMDAHLWLWCDKDSSLRSNPNIRPDDGRECIPTVEEEWEIDGALVTIAKMQKKKTGKPDANGVSKVSLTNSYSVNQVAKTERDFRKDMEDRGFKFENFPLLSHLDVFTGQKPADMRKRLFDMTTSRTDAEVAQITAGCNTVAELLRTYKAEEIEVMNKASKKRADEQLAAIPNQIIGLEKAKVDIDVAELEIQKRALEAQITQLEERIAGDESAAAARKNADEAMALLRKANEIAEQERKKLQEKKNAIYQRLRNTESRKTQAEGRLAERRYSLTNINANISFQKQTLEIARESYRKCVSREFDETKIREVEAEKFNESALICPTCGHPYPADKQEEMRRAFSESKERRINEQIKAREQFEKEVEKTLAEVTAMGNEASEKLKVLRTVKESTESGITGEEEGLSTIQAEIRGIQEELSRIPQEPDLESIAEYVSLQQEYQRKEKEAAELSKLDALDSLKDELRGKREELSAVVAEIAKSDNNVRIDGQIEELEKRKKACAQNKADAERILYQLSLVSRAKNELLTQEINSHFDGVRFKLYNFLKNGNYEETCIPEIFDGEEWKNMFESANTSLSMRGKLAIIRGLQEYHGQHLPVFVDGAEALDSENLDDLRTQANCQEIYLKVTDDELSVQRLN